jgi:hypothetical protein
MKLRLFMVSLIICVGTMNPIQAVFEKHDFDDDREGFKTRDSQRSITKKNALDSFLPEEARKLQILKATLESYEGQPLTPKTLKKKAALRFEISQLMQR